MVPKNLQKYTKILKEYSKRDYKKMFREPDGELKHKFIVPGASYQNCLWDWDSWLTDLALRKIAPGDDIVEYEKGCIQNFIDHIEENGKIAICLVPYGEPMLFKNMKNIHKPCLAQHVLFICENCGDYEWMRENFKKVELFLSWYTTNCKHETGLYFWRDDGAIGVDNEPCTFYRPENSSASIYLNCLMYKEFLAMAKLAEGLGIPESRAEYEKNAGELLGAIRENCYDERDGFYYSVDINLIPVEQPFPLHSGAPRHWNCLIQRIGVWTGFMAMWANIATPEQAERMVKEHYKNKSTFCAPYGVRSLSKMEKMYSVKKSGNPSCWLGPIWGIANYMTFVGLVNYGYIKEAKELAVKTIKLFGRDVEGCGEFHEYYDPESGEGVHNPGFQSWNLLVVNMIEWLENTDV